MFGLAVDRPNEKPSMVTAEGPVFVSVTSSAALLPALAIVLPAVTMRAALADPARNSNKPAAKNCTAQRARISRVLMEPPIGVRISGTDLGRASPSSMGTNG